MEPVYFLSEKELEQANLPNRCDANGRPELAETTHAMPPENSQGRGKQRGRTRSVLWPWMSACTRSLARWRRPFRIRLTRAAKRASARLRGEMMWRRPSELPTTRKRHVRRRTDETAALATRRRSRSAEVAEDQRHYVAHEGPEDEGRRLEEAAGRRAALPDTMVLTPEFLTR